VNQRNVVPIRRAGDAPVPPDSKRVAANQKAIEALPLNSGTWRVEGVAGLYIRCRAQSRSYFIQRKVRGRIVKTTIGEMTLKQARLEAQRIWSAMKPKPPARDAVTLQDAFEDYIENKLDRRGLPLADKTKRNYHYNLDRYLADWKARTLADIGEDLAGVRRLQAEITRKHGRATANQVVRLLSSVYRWRRKIDRSLPESPTAAVSVYKIDARDWALSEDELKAWWRAVQKLGPVKRMWWATALLTGARKGSIEALRWRDVNLEKKVIHFTVTKGDRPYHVPMSDRLAELLAAYRDSGEVAPSEWVFPSRQGDGHLVDVKDDKRGVAPAHRLRHTYRTALAQLGASPDQARMLMGHAVGDDVSTNYVTSSLVVESLRVVTNAVSAKYGEILGW
jgi:integrase